MPDTITRAERFDDLFRSMTVPRLPKEIAKMNNDTQFPDILPDGRRIPSLLAVRDSDTTVRVFCRYCSRWHVHGDGGGHRVAHCQADDSPYRDTGYFLVEVHSIPDAPTPKIYKLKYQGGQIVSGFLRAQRRVLARR